MLLFADTFLRLVASYRILWIAGRLGGGKTALAYLLARELLLREGLRYLFSNCLSVWNDNPEWMEQKDGVFCDAVCLLDEAGEFMDSPSEVRGWTSFLRKVNLMLLLPSVRPPHHTVRFLTVQRILNLNVVGLPIWVYRWDLDSGNLTEHGYFTVLFPSRIFGIYDTLGFPQDADVLLSHIKTWRTVAATTLGYASKGAVSETLQTVSRYGQNSSGASSDAEISQGRASVVAMDDFRGDVDALILATKQTQKALSLSRRQSKRR